MIWRSIWHAVWIAWRKRDHVYYVNGRLKVWPREFAGGGMLRSRVHVQRIVSWFEKMWLRKFAWASGILYSQEHFQPEENGGERQICFTDDPYCPLLWVCISAVFDSLSLSLSPVCTFGVVKAKRIETNYNVFVHQRFFPFLCYTTIEKSRWVKTTSRHFHFLSVKATSKYRIKNSQSGSIVFRCVYVAFC